MEKTEYHELLNFAKECDKFSEACQNRNKLFEDYKREADKLIDHQTQKNVSLQDELSASKRKNYILYPILGTALGIFLGGYLIKK